MLQSFFNSLSSVIPLFLLILLARRGAAAEDCTSTFVPGDQDFLPDAEEGVREGATPLATATVPSADACRQTCCGDPRCNVVLVEPRHTAEEVSCVLFDCVHRNRFVCRFVNKTGYQTSIRGTTYRKYLMGPGRQAPPIADAGRDVVVQPGDVVTLNGIESVALRDKSITKYSWSLQSGDVGVQMNKTDLPDQVMLSKLKPGSYVFMLTVTDSKSQTGNATVSVLVLSTELSSSYCRDPVKIGPCRAAFPRWRYNVEKTSCEQFTFGGCLPNKNNYLSKEECGLACRGVTVSTRSNDLPATEKCGQQCLPDEMTCKNGCCLDRSLECDGVKQCSDASDEDPCDKLNQTFSELLDIKINENKVRCTELPRTGPCRASFTRWYYDPANLKCYHFTYGGCDGNENNFEKIEECGETCKGVSEKNVFSRGMFERFETDDPEDNSGSVTLGVILAVTILALLAVTAYCFLRARKERAQNSVVTSPAHEPLTSQDTEVYNSTTKPV